MSRKITVRRIQELKEQGEKISMLTCYEASFATLMERAGVEMLLVGDSLGMTVQGEKSTLPVTLEAMIYHTKAVARGASRPLIVVDLPFGSYEAGPKEAFRAAVALMQAGAEMVKLEGGASFAPITEFLVARGIPVAAHIGLLPQAVNIEGYRVQGRDDAGAEQLLADAKAHERAGASLLVMECIPALLATKITEALTIPTIGIGAGSGCDGQVLVMHDMLGAYPGKVARFVHNFMAEADSIEAAFHQYVAAVKAGQFPAEQHTF